MNFIVFSLDFNVNSLSLTEMNLKRLFFSTTRTLVKDDKKPTDGFDFYLLIINYYFSIGKGREYPFDWGQGELTLIVNSPAMLVLVAFRNFCMARSDKCCSNASFVFFDIDFHKTNKKKAAQFFSLSLLRE